MPGGNGWFANLEDPRYAAANGRSAPTVAEQDLARSSPARTGRVWGSLFLSPTNYTRFTGGLCQLAEDGTTAHTLAAMVKPYSYVGISPTEAWERGFKVWRPKLSAFTNRALGAANADRTPATRVEGPLEPGKAMAIPRTSFFADLPKNQYPPFNRQPGYVTRWPSAPMTFAQMGGGGQGA
jgi:hypothetical protein